MKLPVLYHRGKAGAIYCWTLSVKGNVITTKYGQLGGRMQTTSKEAKAKNVGKANEVNPQDQAAKEARAMHKKKLDLKYSTTPEEAQQPVFLPMLAHSFDKVKEVTYPADIQPKLNGVRCLASWDGPSIRLTSRGGKDYDIQHLKADVASFLPSNMILDGEIYLHGATFQAVTRLVKKFRPGPTGTASLQLWAYDVFEADKLSTPWTERSRHLDEELECTTGSVLLVPSQIVTSKQEVLVAQAKYVEQGFEGGIVRLHNGTYELGHRSRSLLKVKSFQDDEYPIVGFESGVGRFADCVIWRCQTPQGKEFRVVPKGTLEDKREWLKEASVHVGRMLTVKYFALSEAGVPVFPVGLGIRGKNE